MKTLSVLLLLSLVTVSCQKFFDIAPVDRVYENKLFLDRYGFETALSSVYTTLAANNLYGKELTYGFVEALVGSYTNIRSSGHAYYREYGYEYDFPSVEGKIGSIWAGFYGAINQLNIIEKNLYRIKDDPYYDLIRGESLGLRAFAHFQLLKLFGPVVSQEGLDVPAVIYRDTLTFEATKISTAREVIRKIKIDLSLAKALLIKDPIRTVSRTANLNQFDYEKYNSLLDRRGVRLNYYAVVALQAMVAQWEGDSLRATNYAEELIAELNDTKSITLAVPSDFSSNSYSNNIRTSSENIFGLHVRNLRSSSLSILPAIEDNRGLISPLLYPNYNWLRQSLYAVSEHGSTNDYRLASWFNDGRYWKLVKYAIPPVFNPIAENDPGNNNYLQVNAFEVKILSLHTIYLIAAEGYVTTDPNKSLVYLNTVRRTRGLTVDITHTATLTPTALANLIFMEFRKDNIANGTLFTEYKRLFRPIDRVPNVIPTVRIFRFPIPKSELLYNPN